MDINSGNPDWYEQLLAAIAEWRSESLTSVSKRANSIMARSEAIRYVQLGSPESILIDDGSVSEMFFPDGLAAILEA